MNQNLRNIAIIAHVDHGKTTLVDQLLRQSQTLSHKEETDRVMDSNALEKERGITILSKCTAISWQDTRINIVDTPGHADFGGEVERILSMVDSVLLLVDATDGPMPQTRFVSQKAFECGLQPIVVVNKIDRPSARPDWVVDQVFDLFDQLGATDEQLDFQVVYASALQGYACLDPNQPDTDMSALFKAILDHVPPPQVNPDGPLQMQISALDYSSYVGTIGIGRITSGSIKPPAAVKVISREGEVRSGRLLTVMTHLGLERVETEQAFAGDIVAVTGLDDCRISDTLCDPEHVEALPALSVDEPAISMIWQANDSPFAGREGRWLTSRQIAERLDKELIHNVALRVEQLDGGRFLVSGRGELHLSVLLETMRREGFELAVSKPEAIVKEIDGVAMEPFEQVTFDIDQEHQGAVMEAIGERLGQLQDMQPDLVGRMRLVYDMPARGLIGFRSQFLSMTAGTGVMTSIFDRYDARIPKAVAPRSQGVLIANCAGTALGYALFNLQNRGRMLIKPGTEVYEGMVVGIHSRSNDLTVNVTKAKQLTNVRAAGSDENILLTPAITFSLEEALEFIEADEWVEMTPEHIRIRKKFLKEHERKRASKQTTS